MLKISLGFHQRGWIWAALKKQVTFDKARMRKEGTTSKVPKMNTWGFKLYSETAWHTYGLFGTLPHLIVLIATWPNHPPHALSHLPSTLHSTHTLPTISHSEYQEASFCPRHATGVQSERKNRGQGHESYREFMERWDLNRAQDLGNHVRKGEEEILAMIWEKDWNLEWIWCLKGTTNASVFSWLEHFFLGTQDGKFREVYSGPLKRILFGCLKLCYLLLVSRIFLKNYGQGIYQAILW